MKKYLPVLLLTLFLMVSTGMTAADNPQDKTKTTSETMDKQSQNLPEVKAEDNRGEVVNLSDFADGESYIIVTFWSVSCKPCIEEIDTFCDMLEEWNELRPVKLIAVSIDDSKSQARAKVMASGRGWNDAVLLFDKNQELKRALNVVYTPQLFVFDGRGKAIYSHTGYAPGDEEKIPEILVGSVQIRKK